MLLIIYDVISEWLTQMALLEPEKIPKVFQDTEFVLFKRDLDCRKSKKTNFVKYA